MKRANLGCGSIRPDGWDNYDIDDWDVRYGLHECELLAVEQQRSRAHDRSAEHRRRVCPRVANVYDYAVADHMLMALNHHELKDALRNIHDVLKPGGMLRVAEADIVAGWSAFAVGDEAFFPQDENTPGIDAKFSTWLTWYGTRKSVFTLMYLRQLLLDAGFSAVKGAEFGLTFGPEPGCMDLDSRKGESFFLEAFK